MSTDPEGARQDRGAGDSAVIAIRPLTADDRAAWDVLWAGYNTFYQATVPDAVTAETWRRFHDPAVPLHALGAWRGAELIGFATYVLHPSTWSIGPYCYLEDLFTAPAARGLGAGRGLIAAVEQAAQAAGATRLYWVTQDGNAQARALYNQLADLTGFVQYRKELA